jgi:cell division protein FtsB
MSDDLTIAYMLGVEDMRSKLHKQADEIERLRAENEKLREDNEKLRREAAVRESGG